MFFPPRCHEERFSRNCVCTRSGKRKRIILWLLFVGLCFVALCVSPAPRYEEDVVHIHRHKDEGRTASPPSDAESTLIVLTSDGTLWAVDTGGRYLWQYKLDDPPVAYFEHRQKDKDSSSSSSSRSSGTRTSARLVPSFDSSLLYIMEEGSPLYLKVTLKELITRSPFTSPLFPGYYFTGTRETRVHSVDLNTGDNLVPDEDHYNGSAEDQNWCPKSDPLDFFMKRPHKQVVFGTTLLKMGAYDEYDHKIRWSLLVNEVSTLSKFRTAETSRLASRLKLRDSSLYYQRTDNSESNDDTKTPTFDSFTFPSDVLGVYRVFDAPDVAPNAFTLELTISAPPRISSEILAIAVPDTFTANNPHLHHYLLDYSSSSASSKGIEFTTSSTTHEEDEVRKGRENHFLNGLFNNLFSWKKFKKLSWFGQNNNNIHRSNPNHHVIVNHPSDTKFAVEPAIFQTIPDAFSTPLKEQKIVFSNGWQSSLAQPRQPDVTTGRLLPLPPIPDNSKNPPLFLWLPWRGYRTPWTLLFWSVVIVVAYVGVKFIFFFQEVVQLAGVIDETEERASQQDSEATDDLNTWPASPATAPISPYFYFRRGVGDNNSGLNMPPSWISKLGRTASDSNLLNLKTISSSTAKNRRTFVTENGGEPVWLAEQLRARRATDVYDSEELGSYPPQKDETEFNQQTNTQQCFLLPSVTTTNHLPNPFVTSSSGTSLPRCLEVAGIIKNTIPTLSTTTSAAAAIEGTGVQFFGINTATLTKNDDEDKDQNHNCSVVASSSSNNNLTPSPNIPPNSPLSQVLENGRLFRTLEDITLIGRGGFGAVYRARHRLEPGQPIYAVKFIHLRMRARDVLGDRKYFREVSAGRDILSKHVVRYFIWWCEEPQYLPDEYSVVENRNSNDANNSTTGLECKNDMKNRPQQSNVAAEVPRSPWSCWDGTDSNTEYGEIDDSNSGIPPESNSNSFSFGRRRRHNRSADGDGDPSTWPVLVEDDLVVLSEVEEDDHDETLQDDEESDGDGVVFEHEDSIKAVSNIPSASLSSHDLPPTTHNGGAHQLTLYTRPDLVVKKSTAVKTLSAEGQSALSQLDTRDNIQRVRRKNKSADHQEQTYPVVLLIQMEMCPGVTLRQWLDGPSRSVEAMNFTKSDNTNAVELDLFRQLIKGIRDIHARGIVHRDLKPDNIIVDPVTQLLKIGDFGLARFVSASRKEDDTTGSLWDATQSSSPPFFRSDSQVSIRGQVIGTPGYAAPEGGALCSEKADIFSASVMLLELVCPRFETLMERYKVLEEFRISRVVPSFLQKCLPEYLELMTNMSQNNPADRPSAEEIYKRIKEMEGRANLCSNTLPPDATKHPREDEATTTEKIVYRRDKRKRKKSSVNPIEAPSLHRLNAEDRGR